MYLNRAGETIVAGPGTFDVNALETEEADALRSYYEHIYIKNVMEVVELMQGALPHAISRK